MLTPTPMISTSRTPSLQPADSFPLPAPYPHLTACFNAPGHATFTAEFKLPISHHCLNLCCKCPCPKSLILQQALSRLRPTTGSSKINAWSFTNLALMSTKQLAVPTLVVPSTTAGNPDNPLMTPIPILRKTLPSPDFSRRALHF